MFVAAIDPKCEAAEELRRQRQKERRKIRKQKQKESEQRQLWHEVRRIHVVWVPIVYHSVYCSIKRRNKK